MTSQNMAVAAKEQTVIDIPRIVLCWSPWHSWDDVNKIVKDGGVNIPNGIHGVYEAKLQGKEDRLTIGKASNLRHRVRQGLARGKARHSSGKDIRGNENVSDVVVRWAVTDRPAAAEEELHRRHRARFGGLPKYTDHT